jgi:hypothetical protein
VADRARVEANLNTEALTRRRIIVIGDLNIDYFIRSVDIMAGHLRVPGSAKPGGVGYNAATAMHERGLNVHLVGAVGDDENGQILRNHLAAARFPYELIADDDRPTGECNIILSELHADPIRLNFMGSTSANHIRPADLTNALQQIAAGPEDLAFLTCHALVRGGHAPEFYRVFDEIGCACIIDLVPHGLVEYADLRTLSRILPNRIWLLISTLSTVRALLKHDRSEDPPDTQDILGIHESLPAEYFSLRYGKFNHTHEDIWRVGLTRDVPVLVKRTADSGFLDEESAGKTGFGELMTANNIWELTR